MDVIALRRKFGANSDVGRHCSDLEEMRLNLLDAVGEQRSNLLASITRTERALTLLLVGAA